MTENTIDWMIKNFSKPDSIVDNKAKVVLKAITESNFEFFEAFAVNFNKAIYNLITTSQDKKYINKYIFKIIEKCIIKTKNFEKVSKAYK